MSVVVYDKDGTRCLVRPESLQAHIKSGYRLTLDEKPAKKADDFDREAAIATLKEAGVKVHHKAGADKLKEMLKALEENA